MKIRLANVGCRLNVAELQEIERGLVRSGHEIASPDESPDLCILNTCAVTRGAEADSRRMAARLRRNHPGARLVLTGCYAELHGENLLGRVDSVVKNADKDGLVAAIPAGDAAPGPPTPIEQAFRTRTFLKVQDGCDCRCHFCIITVARGASRSVPEETVLARVREQVVAGDPELVLTGVHLGSYGADLKPVSSLTRLVARILRETEVPRLRLSSIEPWELTPDLVGLFSNRRLLPHLHLPLQSGCEETLRRMGRRTNLAAFRAFVERARRGIPDLSVSTDIIVGHPGETAAAFDESLCFVEAVRFSRLHVFRYSPREGTRSASMAERVPAETAAKRALRMRERGEALRRDYEGRFLGRELPVLWDREKLDKKGVSSFGLTDHYVRVRCDDAALCCPLGSVSRCRLTEAIPGGGFIGTPVPAP